MRRAHAGVFFFGVGIPWDTQQRMLEEHKRDQLEAHAIEFFNLMLKSFPNLKGKAAGSKRNSPAQRFRRLRRNADGGFLQARRATSTTAPCYCGH